MTNLEALECIVVDLTPTAKEHNKEEIEQVKKSLEIYEIFCKMRKYEDLTDEELKSNKDKRMIKKLIIKIKEWLENE